MRPCSRAHKQNMEPMVVETHRERNPAETDPYMCGYPYKQQHNWIYGSRLYTRSITYTSHYSLPIRKFNNCCFLLTFLFYSNYE